MVDKISEMIELVNTIVNEGKISLDKASETYLVEYPAEQTHEVFKVPDGWYCSCKSYLDNGICEHILAVNATPRVAEIVETRRPFRRPDYPRDRGDRRIPGRRPPSGRPSQGRDWSRRPDRRSPTPSSRRG